MPRALCVGTGRGCAWSPGARSFFFLPLRCPRSLHWVSSVPTTPWSFPEPAVSPFFPPLLQKQLLSLSCSGSLQMSCFDTEPPRSCLLSLPDFQSRGPRAPTARSSLSAAWRLISSVFFGGNPVAYGREFVYSVLLKCTLRIPSRCARCFPGKGKYPSGGAVSVTLPAQPGRSDPVHLAEHCPGIPSRDLLSSSLFRLGIFLGSVLTRTRLPRAEPTQL